MTQEPPMRRATPPPSPLPKPSSDLTTWTFDLETITPILGGGVEPFEPDTIDIVRVPGIRGHLRWWWRALFATTHDLDNPEELLKREAKLWGGLVEPNPERSPVRLRVEITSKSAPGPAGRSPAGSVSCSDTTRPSHRSGNWCGRR